MTLLALDPVVPAATDHVTDRALRHLLADDVPSYPAFRVGSWGNAVMFRLCIPPATPSAAGAT